MKTTMDICLSHESALEMWRDIDLIDDPTIDACMAEVRFNRNPLRAPLIMPTRALAVSRLPFGLVGASLPLHVLVGSPSMRNQVPDLACHVCSKAALEYDGAEYHSSDAQIAHDQRRRNILASLGITVLVMRKEQLHNEQELILIAQTIARHLGVRFRPRANGWRWLNRDLRRELLSPQA